MKTTEEMISIMQAYVDGKEIEINSWDGNGWNDEPEPEWNWSNNDYRVKKEPKQTEYVPFSFEDAEFLIGKVVKHKKDSWVELITYCDKNETSIALYEYLLDNFTFLDGSPCGKLNT